ncbi:MAG: hypothetical protein HC888_13890 [Candidatus Competibacteraceae bacterium]|nr:hypothetical protein [Candidatus Competibacteraceae bacterium]
MEVERSQSYSRNFVPNASAINNVSSWTASSVTVARDTDAADAFDGIASFALTSATNPATFCTADIPVPEPYDDGVNGEVKVWFKGDASKWQLEIRSSGGSTVLNDLDLRNATTWTPASFNYPVSDNYRICVSSNAASPANINAAGFYWGPATNITEVAQSSFWGGMEQVGASGCSYAQNTSSGIGNFIDLGTSTGCNAWTVAGAATAVGNNDHRITMTMAPGTYLFQISGAFFSTANNLAFFRLSDGTNNYQPQTLQNNNVGVRATNMMTYSVTIPSGSEGVKTYKLQGSDDTAVTTGFDNSSSANVAAWKVYRFPSQSEIAVRPDQSADLMGTVFYTPGSVCPAGSAAANGGSTAGYTAYAGRFGANFPDLRGIFIRGTGTNATATSGNVGGALSAIQNDQFQGHLHSVDPPSTASSTDGSHSHRQLLTNGTPGGSQFADRFLSTGETDYGTSSTGLAGSHSHTTNIGAFDSAVPKTDGSNGTPRTGSETRPSNISLTPCVWVVSSHAPLLMGGVTSNSPGMERVERVKVGSVCSSSPCTITSQSGSWVSSITRGGAGSYTANIVAGTFADAPTCFVQHKGSSGANNASAVSESSATVVTFNFDNGVSGEDSSFNIFCQGPR